MEGSILITGAMGGLGIALVAAARARGWSVLATGRSTRHGDAIRALGATFIQADLSAPGSAQMLCEGQTNIIHAAALSSSWGQESAFQAANVDVTKALLEEAQKGDVRRFVFVSSPSIFASLNDRILIGDNDAPSDPPLNYYAQTKLMAERLVLAASRPGFATVAIRPRALVGPDDRVLLPKLMSLARRRLFPLPGGGRALIELTDVRDAAAAIVSALELAPALTGQGFNISGGVPLQVAHVARELASALNLNPIMVPVPLALAGWLAKLFEAKAQKSGTQVEPVLTRYTLATLGYSQTFDLKAAREHLNWSPQYNGLASLIGEAKRRAV